jgi:hypothetical protein
MKRIGHFSYIIYCLAAGIILMFLPWQGIWENNYLLYLHPEYRPILANPYFKGAVMGLGILNILIGIQRIVRPK